MRKALSFVLIALACLIVTGCVSARHKVFVKQEKKYAEVVLPRYKAYIDADTTLDEESKAIRKKTADDWWNFIENELERIEEDD